MKTIEDFVLKNLSTLENGDLTLQVPNDLLYNALNHYTLPVLLQSMLVYYDEILNLRTLLSLPPSEDEFLTNLRELIQQPIIIYPFSADNHGGPGPVKLTLSNGSKIVVKFRFGQADVLFTEMLGAINRLEGTHDLPYYQQRSLDNRYLISEYVEGMTVPLGGTILDYMKNEPAAAKKKFLKLEYVSRMTGLTDMHSENYKGLDGTIYPIDLESYNPASATGFLDSLSRHISNGEKLTFLRAAGLTSIEDPEQLYTDSIASQLFAPDKLAEIKQIIDEVRHNIYMTVKRFVPVPTFSFLNIWAEDESVRAASLFTLLKDALDGSFDYNPSKLKELCSKILDNPPGYVPMFLIQGNCLYYNSIDANNLVGTKAG